MLLDETFGLLTLYTSDARKIVIVCLISGQLARKLYYIDQNTIQNVYTQPHILCKGQDIDL